MKRSRVFSIGILFVFFLLIAALFVESYGAAEKACYAWSAHITFSCTFDFLHAGFFYGLSHHFLFGIFFPGGIVDVQPNPLLSSLFVAVTILLLVGLIGAAAFLLRGRLPNGAVITEPESHKKTLVDYWIFISLLSVFGLSILYYLRQSAQAPTDLENHAIILNPTYGKSRSNTDTLMRLLTAISTGALSAAELERDVRTSLQDEKLNPQGMSKLFDAATGRCRDDYIDVLLKFPVQPDPRGYDKSYMQFSYANVTDPGCEKIYTKMGWSEGCEVELKTTACLEFTRVQAQYFSHFEKGTENLACNDDQDCYQSERGQCGRSRAIAKAALSSTELLNEQSQRCPFKKLFALCAKEDPAFLRCDKIDNSYAKCVSRKCTLISPQ